jgi:hypothetical protein
VESDHAEHRPRPTTFTRRSGPGGLFNAEGNAPVPSPWFTTPEGVTGYIEERHDAWRALEGTRRQPELMPVATENFGALTVRLTSGGITRSVATMAPGAILTTSPSGTASVVFGPNDRRSRAGKEYGLGTLRVAIMWLSG